MCLTVCSSSNSDRKFRSSDVSFGPEAEIDRVATYVRCGPVADVGARALAMSAQHLLAALCVASGDLPAKTKAGLAAKTCKVLAEGHVEFGEQ